MFLLDNCDRNGFTTKKIVFIRRTDYVFVYVLIKNDNYYIHKDSMRREKEKKINLFFSLSSYERLTIEKKEKEKESIVFS